MQALGAIYNDYPTLILFLHVISAVVWVGGMIAMRFAAHHSFMALKEPPRRLERITHALKRLFTIVAPFVVILLLTALMMAVSMDLHQSEQASWVFAKEAIWTIMALNYLLMVLRRNKAERLIESGNLIDAKRMIGPIGTFMVPFNILLGIVAIYLGVTLRFGG
ncbi:MAG: hypothetical protein R3302_00755 [Sulfurimonadaceae bacterium]|nr:hypothetical protein [Sulfurimonadaceae bacterium]